MDSGGKYKSSAVMAVSRRGFLDGPRVFAVAGTTHNHLDDRFQYLLVNIL
jgi:hypothetical protein